RAPSFLFMSPIPPVNADFFVHGNRGRKSPHLPRRNLRPTGKRQVTPTGGGSELEKNFRINKGL
ncbi:MAG TPA: hypothetical protein VGS61_02790, partial [Acidimicrobiales bacterium]|nr:hypothetical protein [Acidimicrobiales bacterium]